MTVLKKGVRLFKNKTEHLIKMGGDDKGHQPIIFTILLFRELSFVLWLLSNYYFSSKITKLVILIIPYVSVFSIVNCEY